MKNLHILRLCTWVAALFFLASCDDDKELDHTQVSEVTNLFSPENNKFIKLEPASGSTVFEWAPAMAEDNGLVFYEVVFDRESGDFSDPVYSVKSDNNGMGNSLTMTYGTLNQIAKMAGIASQEIGKIKWTVFSSKGINVKKPSVSHTLELERPAGFSEIPSALYLTGSATEAGETLGDAIPFKLTKAGEFEIYTALKAGTYRFTAGNSGNPLSFSIQDGKMVEGGTTTVTGDQKIYRIRLNLNNATAEFTEIKSVGLWFSAENKIWYELPYTGKGTWEIKNAPVEFFQESWGRDERYKFRFTVLDEGGAEAMEWYGSQNRDNSRPGSSTQPSYWYMVPVDNSRYDFAFKFNENADRKNADIKVDFSGTSGPYTHSVTVK
ncbi:SusE domain-containing protein [Sabulibacter ruber]|uniref:SusE domain-containing protein n=1 Tax=Sabulibacter ruber TaxID=2811901 RepID=UPI001A9669BA|nr:SusE domain-containing protein [Sabulibacter ruber]